MVPGDVMIGDASLLASPSLLCFACLNLVILGVRAAAWMIASGDTQGFCARIRRTWASSSFVGGCDAIFGIHEDFAKRILNIKGAQIEMRDIKFNGCPVVAGTKGVKEERLQTKKASTTEARSGRSRAVPYAKGFLERRQTCLKGRKSLRHCHSDSLEASIKGDYQTKPMRRPILSSTQRSWLYVLGRVDLGILRNLPSRDSEPDANQKRLKYN